MPGNQAPDDFHILWTGANALAGTGKQTFPSSWRQTGAQRT